jgi:hypothetical protein
MNAQVWRVSIFVMLAAFVACSKKGEDTDAAGTADSAQSQAGLVASDRDEPVGGQGAKDLGTLVDLIVAESADLPRAEFDPAALASKLGKDPQAHFEWVRDHTWWAPYRGLLRGSKGVLLDRVGSSLDRAVLLGDLLRRAGHTVRLAHAELPPDLARELLAKVRPIPDKRRPAAAQRPESAERQRAIEAAIPGYAQGLEEQSANSSRARNEAEALVKSQSDRLGAAVKSIASAGNTAGQQVISALQDHWWVEREQGGNWIAMDVLLPDARSGTVVATASARSNWKSTDTMPAIPESEWHTVELSVVVERYDGGNTTESIALETTLRPAVVFDRPISLSHMPKPWPDRLPDLKSDPMAIANTVVNVKEWIPFFQIGDDYVAQSGFTESGDLKANPLSALTDISEGGGGGFDAALGGGETPLSYVTAEWIDYEIRVPGGEKRRLRRPVFDLLGPARRSAQTAGYDGSTNDLLISRYEALLSRTDILLQPSDFSDEFVAHLMSASIVANQAALKALARESDPVKASSEASTVLSRIDNWGPLPNLVLWRTMLGGQSGDWFIDQPNVLTYRITGPVVNVDRAPTRELIDIASNPVGVRSGARRNAFDVRLHQGVADTVAEMLAICADLRTSENTAAVFAMTGAEPNRSILIGSRDMESVRKLGWSDDVTARLAANVEAGSLAVVPSEPVSIQDRPRVGWWRVDPSSGETIGVMDTGYHASTTEKNIMEYRNALREWMKNNADRIRQARSAARDPFTPVSEGQRGLLWTADRVMNVLRQTAQAGF